MYDIIWKDHTHNKDHLCLKHLSRDASYKDYNAEFVALSIRWAVLKNNVRGNLQSDEFLYSFGFWYNIVACITFGICWLWLGW